MRIAAIGEELGVKKISLLPYHEGGKSKSEQIGRPYPFSEGRAPSDEHMGKLKQIIERAGLKVSIGS